MEERLQEIQQRIEHAANKVGKNVDDITLIAVSKTYPAEDIMKAYEIGCKDFGENKVQELMGKIEVINAPVNWHLIGHLQTNKVKYVIGQVELIHSVDSLRLLEEIEKQSAKKGVVTNVLLEVNVAEEETKHGFRISEITDILPKVAELNHVHVKGLMTVAPYVEDPEENRSIFRKLFKISVDMEKQNIDNISNEVLSMGMSNDFEVAIEEGATMVRIGTALFGKRDYA